MIEKIIFMLVFAFILSILGIADILIQGIYDLTGYRLTESAYFVVFALLGAASGLFSKG